MTLRVELIEAGARALYEAQFPGFDYEVVRVVRSGSQYLALAGAALDAFLDHLEANVDEWEELVWPSDLVQALRDKP